MPFLILAALLAGGFAWNNHQQKKAAIRTAQPLVGTQDPGLQQVPLGMPQDGLGSLMSGGGGSGGSASPAAFSTAGGGAPAGSSTGGAPPAPAPAGTPPNFTGVDWASALSGASDMYQPYIAAGLNPADAISPGSLAQGMITPQQLSDLGYKQMEFKPGVANPNRVPQQYLVGPLSQGSPIFQDTTAPNVQQFYNPLPGAQSNVPKTFR